MTVGEWIHKASSELEAVGIESARLDAEVLAAHALGVERSEVVFYPEREIDNEVALRLLERRLRGEPIAYIVGYKEFYGRRFFVDGNVLIPRPETETLVECALGCWKKGSVCVDVGTGSGIIAITVALEEDEPVIATDVSRGALEVAARNVSVHAAKVQLVQMDCLEAFKSDALDLVVSNPPYVSPDDPRLAKDVRDWEPGLALFSENGTAFIRRLCKQAHRCLRPGGHVVLEVAGPSQAAEVCSYADGFQRLPFRCDLSGELRVVMLRKLS